MLDLSIKQQNYMSPVFSDFQGNPLALDKTISSNHSDSFQSKKDKYKIDKSVKYSLIAFILTQLALTPLSIIANKLTQKNENIKFNFEDIKNLTKQMYEKHKLADKGVYYCFLDKNKPDSATKNILNIIKQDSQNPSKYKKDLLNPSKYSKIRDLIKNDCGGGVLMPLNSNFLNIGKNNKYLAITTKESAFSIFHELGHAINYKNKYISRIPKINSISARYISTVIFFITLLSKKDNIKRNKKENKTIDFFKKHTGILVSLSYLPCLIDEAFASINALKFIKNNSNNSIFYNILRKNLSFAFGTYLISYFISLMSIKIGLKTRDKYK